MYLKKLLLQNFRSFSSYEITFSPTKNIIYGDNGVGKTNILEAIHLLSTARSFRTQNLADLISKDKTYFYIEAEIEKDNISQTIKLYFDKTKKKYIHNTTTHNSFTPLLGFLPSIMHSLDDFYIIKGKPQERRQFLNIFLAQKDPLFVHYYLRYIKALKQKNYLLKTNKTNAIKPFEAQLIKAGSYISLKRDEFLKSLKKPFLEILNILTNENLNLDLKYISSVSFDKPEEIETSFTKLLLKQKQKEIDFRHSLVGPHRDDFSIVIDEKNTKLFASEGQKKLMLYAIRFAQMKLINTPSLLLIDDFDAHLDNFHKNGIKKYLNNLSQVFITAPEKVELDDGNLIFLKK